jgi:leucyl/phenylalanyl-tRNA--protein transferase
VWQGDALVGGVYGVVLGGYFGAESMFHRRTDASKAAIAHLIGHLRARGFLLLDAQVMNPHLEYLGAIAMPRTRYLARLREALAAPVTWICPSSDR